jgi:hypothetical protein
MTRTGGAGKGSGSKGCRGAEHGQACTKERTSTEAVALRAALEIGRATRARRRRQTGKPKWPTLRNVGIRYSGQRLHLHYYMLLAC